MKNKFSIFLLALIVPASVALAQNKETRTVDTFDKIAFKTFGNLYLKQGSPQKVELEGEAETLAKITTEVSNGKLSIQTGKKWNNWKWHNDDKVKIYVTVKDISSIEVAGSGDLEAQTVLTGSDFNVDVSGSGSLTAEINATGDMNAGVSGSGNMNLKGKFKSFTSDVSGSGDIDLQAVIANNASFELSGSGRVVASGSAQNVKASITGSGSIKASDLDAVSCNVSISGSGDVAISVKSSLDASITGSGSVRYKGDPAHVNSHAAGSGSIRKM